MNKDLSPALALIDHVWSNQNGKSWDSINHSMLYATRLAIGALLEFKEGDIDHVQKNFRPKYWLGEHGWEYPYALAISVSNTSFIKEFERAHGRKPFFANQAEPVASEGFTHLVSSRCRVRLSLRSSVQYQGRPGEVSSITNERVVIVLREYGDKKRSIVKLTHEDCGYEWPAPKKEKKSKTEEP